MTSLPQASVFAGHCLDDARTDRLIECLPGGVRQMRIAAGGARLGMSEQGADHW